MCKSLLTSTATTPITLQMPPPRPRRPNIPKSSSCHRRRPRSPRPRRRVRPRPRPGRRLVQRIRSPGAGSSSRLQLTILAASPRVRIDSQCRPRRTRPRAARSRRTVAVVVKRTAAAKRTLAAARHPAGTCRARRRSFHRTARPSSMLLLWTSFAWRTRSCFRIIRTNRRDLYLWSWSLDLASGVSDWIGMGYLFIGTNGTI